MRSIAAMPMLAAALAGLAAQVTLAHAPTCGPIGAAAPLPDCAIIPSVSCGGGGDWQHQLRRTTPAGRQYCLHLPVIARTVPVPLVVYLHRAGGTAAEVYDRTELLVRAASFELAPGINGFALAVPQARHLSGAPSTEPACVSRWDFYHRNFSTGRHCADCPMGNLSTNEDIAMLDEVISAAASSGAVDPTRVYMVGEGDGGFMAQLYSIARAVDVHSVQPSGTCVAASSVTSAGDPFKPLCPTVTYPPPTSSRIPLMITSRNCKDTVCCDPHQPYCTPGQPGYDVQTWVATAHAKLGLTVRWDLVSSTGHPAAGCLHGTAAKPCNGSFPVGHVSNMLRFLGQHESESECWDRYDMLRTVHQHHRVAPRP
jgi:poly(3-hydroxybutyrate) depolymerase